MRSLAFLGILLLQAPAADAPPRIRNTTLEVPSVGVVSYGISVPNDYRPGTPRPLIVALHPGGGRIAYQGSRFIQQVVSPALADLHAIVVAPDCPAASWVDSAAEMAVVALLEHIRKTYTVDPRHVLITGFSMGGRGAWSLSARHAESFTAAIVMAPPMGEGLGDDPGRVPTYVIHSRDDPVAPFAPVAAAARQLEALGHPIHFEPIDGAGHNMSRYVEPLRRVSRLLAERWSR